MSSVLPLNWMTHPKCQVKDLFRTLFRCVSKVIMELIILKILSKYFHVCVLFRYWRCFCIFGVFMGFFFCLFIFFLTHVKLDFLTPALPRDQFDCFVDLQNPVKIQWLYSNLLNISFLWHIHWCFEYNVIALYI